AASSPNSRTVASRTITSATATVSVASKCGPCSMTTEWRARLPMSDQRPVDLMTLALANHVCARVIKSTAPGLEVRQAIEPKNNGAPPQLKAIWRIFDLRRDAWLEVYVDPDNVPL